ncbi:MAG: hypothetical protein E7046_02205 [Lentisphaerae bacterium]|nr:hypothetical protein [Lentisphaerota bacterium]
MRRFWAIARTAAIETMSQPLSAILFPVSMLAVHLLPSLQYHRFGAPGRLARETGLSALLVFGLVFAVPAAVRVIGRELEIGTAAAVLALGVSRTQYFIARLAGVTAVFSLFLTGVLSATLLSSFSCVKASTIIVEHGVVRVWGPAFTAGVSASIMAFAAAAFLNRFANRRFCLWTCILAVVFQFPGLALMDGFAPFTELVPSFFSLSFACVVYIVMAGALSTRFKANGVSTAVVAAVVLGFLMPVGFLAPDMRVFWLEEGCRAALMPTAAGIALTALWSIVGCVSLEMKELG